jgi:hypothetical protein
VLRAEVSGIFHLGSQGLEDEDETEQEARADAHHTSGPVAIHCRALHLPRSTKELRQSSGSPATAPKQLTAAFNRRALLGAAARFTMRAFNQGAL